MIIGRLACLFFPLSEKPLIDGDISGPYWHQAESFKLQYELYPTRLAPAVVETNAWVAISRTHLYIAFDTTGTLAKKYEFRVNPHGPLSDVLHNLIWGSVITNKTAQLTRRVDLTFGISYDDDVEHAERVLQQIVAAHESVLEYPEPVIKLHELADSSVNFIVRPWG